MREDDEEKQHLNYLGSMLGRPNTPEEQEMEDILNAVEKGARSKASPDELAMRQEETGPHTITISSPRKAPFEKDTKISARGFETDELRG